MFDPMNLQIVSDISAKELEDAVSEIRKGNKLNGLGEYFLKAQNDYNINAIILCSIACLESGYGTSKLANEKYNLFGLDAGDNLKGTERYGSSYKNKAESIDYAGYRIGKQYIELDPKADWRYVNSKDIYSVGKKWSSDKEWANKVVSIATSIDKNIDKNKKQTDNTGIKYLYEFVVVYSGEVDKTLANILKNNVAGSIIIDASMYKSGLAKASITVGSEASKKVKADVVLNGDDRYKTLDKVMEFIKNTK